MKVLCLTKYTRVGPSSRYRLYQFQPYLEAAGIELDVQPLVDDRYLDELFQGRRSYGYILRRFARRVGAVLRAHRYDIVYVEREIFPYLPSLAEWLLDVTGVRIVVDIDDAVFLQYEDSPSRLKRALLGNKIAGVLHASSLVLAGNQFLKSYAERYARNVVLFPTVVDAARFRPGNGTPKNERPVVGWIGNPLTARFLECIFPVLRRVAERQQFVLSLVGSPPLEIEGVRVTAKPWSESEEVADLQTFDIGIMPLDESDWCRGKCSLKLLQYMSVGVPSIASTTASAPDIIHDGTNGFLANSLDDWEDRLMRLLASPDLRRSIGGMGRRWIQENYNLQRYGPQLADHLTAAARGHV